MWEVAQFVLKTAKSGEKATGDDAETKKDEASATASMSALGIKKKTVTELTDAVVEEKPEFDRAAMEQEETANLLQSVMAKNKEKAEADEVQKQKDAEEQATTGTGSSLKMRMGWRERMQMKEEAKLQTSMFRHLGREGR